MQTLREQLESLQHDLGKVRTGLSLNFTSDVTLSVTSCYPVRVYACLLKFVCTQGCILSNRCFVDFLNVDCAPSSYIMINE
jgi:hypothetical protein